MLCPLPIGVKKSCACCIFYPKIIALITKKCQWLSDKKSCLIESQLNIKLNSFQLIFCLEIHWVTVGQLCANISELCLEILHSLNYTIAQKFLLLDYVIKYVPHKKLSLGDDIRKWASMLQLFFLQFRSLMRLFSG